MKIPMSSQLLRWWCFSILSRKILNSSGDNPQPYHRLFEDYISWNSLFHYFIYAPLSAYNFFMIPIRRLSILYSCRVRYIRFWIESYAFSRSIKFMRFFSSCSCLFSVLCWTINRPSTHARPGLEPFWS